MTVVLEAAGSRCSSQNAEKLEPTIAEYKTEVQLSAGTRISCMLSQRFHTHRASGFWFQTPYMDLSFETRFIKSGLCGPGALHLKDAAAPFPLMIQVSFRMGGLHTSPDPQKPYIANRFLHQPPDHGPSPG